MKRLIIFITGLIFVMAVLAFGASLVVERSLTRWFEKDIRLRAQLAVSGAHELLADNWMEERLPKLAAILTRMTRDERILAAAACGEDLTVLARTPGFEAFSGGLACQRLGSKVRPATDSPATAWRFEAEVVYLKGGPVHVSAVPLINEGQPLGMVVLVHDLGFMKNRERQTKVFLFAIFGVLALLACLATLLLARLTWSGWLKELRRGLKGEETRPGFEPLLKDVRDLVTQIVEDTEAGIGARAWTAERLKGILTRRLHGEKIIVVANREPYIHERGADGAIAVRHPASGLVTALEPIMRACSGVWVAHGSGSADREMVDQKDRVRVPPGEESYSIRRIWLSAQEEHGYYYGFSNEGLWPLCHLAHNRPDFRSADWENYRAVNERFALATLEESDGDDPVVLVQDYHFSLMPRMVRMALPKATIIVFWHIPWPNPERIGICPWKKELLDGMLGASILGFHTRLHCNNFLDTVDRYLECRIDREESAVIRKGRKTIVRPYPISIEWPVRWLENTPSPEVCRARVIAQHGLSQDALIGVGVDRIDYTKGIEERLGAVERMLELYPALAGRFVFIQLAAPSRTAIERYRLLNESVETLAARINERFGHDGYRPIIFSRRHHEPDEVFLHYRAADLCYVSSIHDGMNLVAKEFIAARDDEDGVLVLSRFTGAAKELSYALLVNPYDLDEAAQALHAALLMPIAERRDRMRAMRGVVSSFNVYRWAGRMLEDAADLRRQERLTDSFDVQLDKSLPGSFRTSY